MAKKNKEEPVKEEVVQNEQAEACDALNEKVAALEEELAKTKDQLLRTAAEYENFRRRSQKEKEALYTDSKTDVLTKLLPVIDNFERASAAQGDIDTYKKGVEMIVAQLLETMKNLGCESFGEAGEEFDPNFHNGVMRVEDENFGENTVAEVFIKGYKIGERVIRPASVKVAN
ncbi:MAG: nucleotide exchange factor GrpE [Clostridia bacterium]|nr:nucleotide exchange factor GrpE [Clostridia bacterium]MBR2414650.1 nucleotide exchange factor GrpE [Clostridia bacterium]